MCDRIQGAMKAVHPSKWSDAELARVAFVLEGIAEARTRVTGSTGEELCEEDHSMSA